MGSLYLLSIMKIQTAIFCFLVVICLFVSHTSAKNLPDINEVEIEKSQADAVLKRNARGLFGFGEEEEKPDDDDDYQYDYGEEEPEEEDKDNNNRNNNRDNNRDNNNNNNGGNGNGKQVDWVNLVVGIINLVKNNFFK